MAYSTNAIPSYVPPLLTTPSPCRPRFGLAALSLPSSPFFLLKPTAAVVAVAPASVETEKCVNTIRLLAVDTVENATTGHAGMPMGCAPIGHILFDEFMRYNPNNPYWFNRDRFVLSAGHGCLLQYILLFLSGYKSITEEDLKRYRQWGSRTPGHPENTDTPGIEVTTGPLGQGMANAVGLALAEKHLAARFNMPDIEIVDHYTYVVMGDGCQMEGVAHEACSLAGHWGLGKLIAFYDENRISVDGNIEIAVTEDLTHRFEALGWHVIHVKNGDTGYDEIREAIKEAKAVKDRPTLIRVRTTIGFGSPNKQNTVSIHGGPLGAKELQITRGNLGWLVDESFHVPEDVRKHWSRHILEGAALEAEWNANFAEYHRKYKDEAAELECIISGKLSPGWEKALPTCNLQSLAASTSPSQQCLNDLARVLPGFLGGCAGLSLSNVTSLKMSGYFQKNSPEERNLHFGVREHGMGAICNGIALHSPGLIPYCTTFLVCSDYMRAPIRLAALSKAGVIFVMTHDSRGLGEGAPTHNAIEQLASFRAMPNILTFRPADGNETVGAYKNAVQNRNTPSIISLPCHDLPQLAGTSAEGVEKGGYVIMDSSTDKKPDVILMGTGSELEIAVKAADKIIKDGKTVRVVSLVCWELFDTQPEWYKESILPASVTARISIEAGSTLGWSKYIGPKGKAIGIDRFGASAPADRLYKEFGITEEAVIEASKLVC